MRILLALAFGAAGLAKLAGVEMMVQTFEQIGIGQWFRYVTAFVELICAVQLLVPRTALLAATLLTVSGLARSLGMGATASSSSAHAA